VVQSVNASYLIAIRGHFVGDPPRPPGSRAPTGSVMTMVVDATTGKVTDGGLGNSYPDLSTLGPVTTDLRAKQPRRASPLTARPTHLTIITNNPRIGAGARAIFHLSCDPYGGDAGRLDGRRFHNVIRDSCLRGGPTLLGQILAIVDHDPSYGPYKEHVIKRY
jgi:hypothetical protein